MMIVFAVQIVKIVIDSDVFRFFLIQSFSMILKISLLQMISRLNKMKIRKIR